MERVIDRLDKYMKFRNLNDNKVTVQCSLSMGLLGKARKNDSDLSKPTIEKILKVYSELNRQWLYHGSEEMIKKASGSQIVSEPEAKFKSKEYSADDIIGKLVETNSLLVITNSKLVVQSEGIITALKEMTSTNAELVKLINANKEDKSEELINGAAKTA